MKKLVVVLSWFIFSAMTIVAGSITYQLFGNSKSPNFLVAGQTLQAGVNVAAANSLSPLDQVKGVETLIEIEDARPQIVANFLKRHDSPLTPHEEFGHKIVGIADKYNIDFRLLPAIAMQESNLCKKIPAGSYNCLGFGIHERGTLAFESYEANFDRAARELKKNYIDQGRSTPEQIMKKYTPSSNGSWAESVNQWMAEMRYDDRQLGRELKTTTDILEFVEVSPSPESP